jgi:hypothetical protein
MLYIPIETFIIKYLPIKSLKLIIYPLNADFLLNLPSKSH